MRVSMTSSTVAGCCRISIFPDTAISFSFLVTASSGPPTFFVNSIRHSALAEEAAFRILSSATSHCSLLKFMISPLSSRPTSNKVSPCPSSRRSCTISDNCCSRSSSSSPGPIKRSFNRARCGTSERSRVSRKASSSCSCSSLATELAVPYPLSLGATEASRPGMWRCACCFST